MTTTPQFFLTPGYGEKAHALLSYSQAVRIGDRVEISGQGGWDDDFSLPESLEDEIRRAFENVERTLNTAGATWRDVVHVNSYHVLTDGRTMAEHHNPVITEEFRRRMPGHAPIWTQVGVTALGLPTMHIEIRVTAVVAQDS